MVERPAVFLLADMQLEGGYIVHKAIYVTARHRITHCHIDSSDFQRKGVQHRDQQTLIRKHDGGI